MARRFTAAVLILVSLALLTVYLREDNQGGLHAAQRLGLSILSPFEVAGERISRPFKDAYGYVNGLVHAKRDKDRLQAEVDSLRQQAAQAQALQAENSRLQSLSSFVDGPRLSDYRRISARILVQPATPFDQQVIVGVGSSDGVVNESPVLDGNGQLVGLVTEVASHEAKVTLITDQSIRVSAIDPGTGARGVLRPSPSGAGLLFDNVPKDEHIRVGDVIVTAGWKYGDLSSLYPKWIQVGKVRSAGLRDIDLYWQIQVDPLVNFDALSEVVILVKP
jgi:rod shape-determining protein MreC